jgi:hypothetical protein
LLGLLDLLDSLELLDESLLDSDLDDFFELFSLSSHWGILLGSLMVMASVVGTVSSGWTGAGSFFV